LVLAIINGALSQDGNKRNSLLSRRPNQFQKSTTTTTPEPVEYEVGMMKFNPRVEELTV
jgi:hypothetical protein